MTIYSSLKAKIKSAVTIGMLAFLLLASVTVAAQQAIVTGTTSPDFFGKPIKLTLINYETRDDKVVQEAMKAEGLLQ